MKKILSVLLTLSILMWFAPLAFSEEGQTEESEPVVLSVEEQIQQLREEVAKLKKVQSHFKLSGEAKTGVYWQNIQTDGKEAEEYIGLHNMDDAGGYQQQGRFRLNMEYENANNLGFKLRIQWQNYGKDVYPDTWPYAFGYGNFFNNQLTVAVGKLGGSPWGTGGPELWKDLENVDKSLGMRIEYKPGFIPKEYGKLNVGFVLNYFNSDIDQGWTQGTINLASIMQESLVGISYIHKYFLIRGAYKLDSVVDALSAIGKEDGGTGEDEIVYRVEETVIREKIPGFKVWALGYIRGLSAPNEEVKLAQNFAFVEYEPPKLGEMLRPFTAQLRFGYDYTENREIMHIKPSFYWNFFDKLISVGASVWYGNDFGFTTDNWFTFLEIEPKVQINFQSSYIAFIYNWRRDYFNEQQAVPGFEPIKQTQKMNLRFCIYF